MDKACLKVMKEAELVIPIGKSFHKYGAFMKKEYLKELIIEFWHNSQRLWQVLGWICSDNTG